MVYITRVKLSRFKGFEDFTVDLDPLTVLVGENGAGKTTILEALCLVQHAFRRVFGGQQEPQFGSPVWDFSFREALRSGTAPADSEDLWFRRQLSDPLQITAEYGVSVRVEVRSEKKEQVTTKLFLHEKEVGNPGNDSAATSIVKEIYALAPTFVRPVGALAPAETRIQHKPMVNQLNAGGFTGVWRNFMWWQNNDNKEAFADFARSVNESLPWMELKEPNYSHTDHVQIRYSEDGIDYEVAQGGGGMLTILSMMAAFELSKCGLALLDEPDAHLHSSLQRTVADVLCRYSGRGARQVIATSHAPDFIEGIPLSSLRWIDRKVEEGAKVTDLGRTLVGLGAVTKADVIRMRKGNVILFVENESDFRRLRMVASKIDQEKAKLLDSPGLTVVPGVKKGDRERLRLVHRYRDIFIGDDAAIVGVFDRDFEGLAEGANFEMQHDQCEGGTLNIFTLARKEIENYLLDPDAISSAYEQEIRRRVAQGKEITTAPKPEDVKKAILEFARTSARENLYDKYFIGALKRMEREPDKHGWANDTKVKEVKRQFNGLMDNEQWILAAIPGKAAFQAVERAFYDSTLVRLSPEMVCKKLSHVPNDLKTIIETVVGLLVKAHEAPVTVGDNSPEEGPS